MNHEHINKARAVTCVHGPDVLEALVRAEYASGESRLGYLEDALYDAQQILDQIKAAFDAEKKAIEAAGAVRNVPRTPEECHTRLMDFVMFGGTR